MCPQDLLDDLGCSPVADPYRSGPPTVVCTCLLTNAFGAQSRATGHIWKRKNGDEINFSTNVNLNSACYLTAETKKHREQHAPKKAEF